MLTSDCILAQKHGIVLGSEVTANGQVADGAIDGHADSETACRLNQDSHTPAMTGDSMLGKTDGFQYFLTHNLNNCSRFTSCHQIDVVKCLPFSFLMAYKCIFAMFYLFIIIVENIINMLKIRD